MPSGSSWSMPCRMIEWVCPPQTSIIAQGRVTVAWMSSSRRSASSGSWNSSRYFTSVSSSPVGVGPSPAAGLLGGPAPLVAELRVELAHLPEELERLQRRLLVEALQREADVDDGVLADLEVGHVGQADLLGRRRRSRPGAIRVPSRSPISSDLAGHC